jgi:hypothetical protein
MKLAQVLQLNNFSQNTKLCSSELTLWKISAFCWQVGTDAMSYSEFLQDFVFICCSGFVELIFCTLMLSF